MTGDDEKDEWRRQERERARMPVIDRLHGAPVRTTASGFPDQRSYRRTGRVVQLPLRVHPRVRALIDAIMRRDGLPSMVALFEAMLDAYQQVHGAIDLSKLPSDEELAFMIERERRYRDV